MSAQVLRHKTPGPLLTSADRQRLSKAVVRIVVERCGVMLISTDARLLTLHSKALEEMLRRDSGLQVSTVEESDEAVLLERFNGLLSHLTMDQARMDAIPARAGHVWIMAVESETRFKAAKTLARLAHDFPGSNLSLVLLIEPELAEDLARSRPGREMMRCTFKSAGEDPESAKVAHLSPATEGVDASGGLYLNGSGAHAVGTDSVATLVRTAAPGKAGLSLSVPAFTLLLLIASAALVGMLFYRPTASLERASIPPVVPPSPQAVITAGAGTSPAPDSAASAATASSPASVATPDAGPLTVATTQATAASVAPRQPDAPPGELINRLAATETWLAAAPANTHTIQLVGSNDEKQVEAYLLRLRSLVDADGIRVFRTKAGGKDSLTVIWGSFADAREAAVARDKLPAELRSSKPILRTVQGINAELKR